MESSLTSRAAEEAEQYRDRMAQQKDWMAQEKEEYEARMAEKLSRQIEQYRRWDGYLRNIQVTKTVQFIFPNPNPMSDEGSFLVLHGKEQPQTGKIMPKPSRYELGGGTVERKIAVFINDVWHTSDEKHTYFSGAWFEAKGFTPIMLNGELLDEESRYNNFNKAIRKYEHGTELELLIHDQFGTKQIIKIKPLEEESIKDATEREGRGEYGFKLETVPVPLLPGEPRVDNRKNRDYVMMVEKTSNNSTHVDIIVLVRWISKGPGEKPEPTETNEIDEMISISLKSPLPTAFSHGKHPEHTIFKSHGMKLIKAKDRLNLLLKFAEETDPICLYYRYIPRKDIHETWDLLFDQNFPIQGMCLRNQGAFDLLMQALREDKIEHIPDKSYVDNLFSPLSGGQNAYLRPMLVERTILHTIRDANTDADEADKKVQELIDTWSGVVDEKPLPMTDEEYAKSLGYVVT